ncbi:MAG: hypothetical protein IPG18_15940 [Saprospiraceae bacterium]|nr:hypothetical protein [Saprospiraceae bacterium]
MTKSIIFIALLFFILYSNLSAQTNLNSKVLDTLIKNAELTQTDALIIYLDGKLYKQYYFGKEPKKIEAMSSTKSIVNLAIGKLLTDSLIKSIDQPIYDFTQNGNKG